VTLPEKLGSNSLVGEFDDLVLLVFCEDPIATTSDAFGLRDSPRFKPSLDRIGCLSGFLRDFAQGVVLDPVERNHEHA